MTYFNFKELLVSRLNKMRDDFQLSLKYFETRPEPIIIDKLMTSLGAELNCDVLSMGTVFLKKREFIENDSTRVQVEYSYAVIRHTTYSKFFINWSCKKTVFVFFFNFCKNTNGNLCLSIAIKKDEWRQAFSKSEYSVDLDDIRIEQNIQTCFIGVLDDLSKNRNNIYAN